MAASISSSSCLFLHLILYILPPLPCSKCQWKKVYEFVGVIEGALGLMEGGWRANSECANASNPFHACAEYCEKRARGPKPRSLLPLLVCAAQIGEPHEENRGLVASHRNLDRSCRNASNPYHHCSDNCWTRTPRAKEQREENRAVISERKEDNKAEKVGMEIIDPNCANASNPYHKCADYCFKK